MASRQPLLHDLAVTLAAPTLCLAGRDGQIRAAGTQGVFHGDVRVLARAVVTVDGAEPEPVAHGVDGAAAEHVVGLLRDHGDPVADPTVWLRRDRTVRPGAMAEVLRVVNRSDREVRADLELAVSADLAPIEVVKAGGATVAVVPQIGPDVRWPGVVLTAPGAALRARGDGASITWPVRLGPRSSAAFRWTLAASDDRPVVVGATRTLTRPSVEAGDPRLARLLDRALDDLDALLVAEPDHPDDVFAAAGAPWYLTLFGRDSLWTATLLLPVDVGVAGGTLRTLARAQGTRSDPATGEQPGKILHERRRGEAAHGTMLLPSRYYGTVDATALWVCLLRDAWRHGLPAAEVRALLPHLHAALGWIRDDADRDGDGFTEYFDDSGRGLANQGWKDSADAVRFAGGAVAEGPVALCEVQGYVHEALVAGAELLTAFDDGDPAPWLARAAALRDRFRGAFWVSDGDGPFPALALDGRKTPVDALTSNIGHLLGTGLVSAEESSEIGRRLAGPDMASGYGLRTMSAGAGGYSPLSYHCGSVWPHDTAVVVRGLQRSGQGDRAAALGVALLDAADGFDGRLPELFAGFGSDEVASPVPYPASCRPQAWAAASVVGLVTALLGLTVDVPAGVVRVAPPSPSPVGELHVRGLVVGGGALDVSLDRGGRVVHCSHASGLRVEVAG
ncbi:glycogen debranching N-terminal domain-containing protein [Pseudonocardia petroleophila]|uniref:Amylo-alpha-1,6-glucosidase n=1 Tax=Pseudonocardia petroleophila TaxID=37331 RepID=A0A7G7MIF1_9PSEU|nr:glycogen debranching N-terminal domain-containing protein [Pseudonocardia petroleophila]QNG52562.1 amylo-alpha-1,6-glucosidase [Pseudonocardia petroleophila]